MLKHNIWIKCCLRAHITFFKVQFNCNILEFESPSFDHQKDAVVLEAACFSGSAPPSQLVCLKTNPS